MSKAIDDLKPIDAPADVTPARLRRAAKDAAYTGRRSLAVVLERAATRVEQLELQVQRLQAKEVTE